VTPGAPAGSAPSECVVNISEGRDPAIVAVIAEAGGDLLLDVHTDPEHHRSVLTLAGPLDEVEAAARNVATAAVAAIDISTHRGVHPRMGAVDVVPFVPLTGPRGAGPAWEAVVGTRNRFAHWMGSKLGVPGFLYGPERTLPAVRRGAFTEFAPDAGPDRPHPTAGATAVGARDVLIAYNVWIAAASPGSLDAAEVVAVARELAARMRRPGLRALGLAVSDGAQVSCNVVDPDQVTLTEVYDDVAAGAAAQGCEAQRGELVGLLPESALLAVPERRWAELGLRAEDAIGYRMGTRRG
jgi:glutamate formiminotransferase / 5-formyltetrahydrofolate cyclo-ligase